MSIEYLASQSEYPESMLIFKPQLSFTFWNALWMFHLTCDYSGWVCVHGSHVCTLENHIALSLTVLAMLAVTASAEMFVCTTVVILIILPLLLYCTLYNMSVSA
jgi:hypothetical protein